MNIKSKSHKAFAKPALAFKKLNTSANSTSSLSSSSSPSLRSHSPVSSTLSPTDKVNENRSRQNAFNSPVNVTDLLMKNGSLETEIPIHSTVLLKNNS